MSAGRVLIVRTGALGDVLHALPAVAALRELAPQTVIDWVVDPRWAPLLVDAAGSGPAVSRVHLAETKLWSRAPFSGATLRSVLALRRALGAGQYASAVDLQGTIRSAVIGRMAASGELVGFADPRESLARLLYRRVMRRRGVHVVEQNAGLLGEALGLQLPPQTPALPVWQEAEGWAERMVGGHLRGRGIALLAPAAGWGAKQWPGERFGTLAMELTAMGLAVLVNAATIPDRLGAEVVGASGGAAALVGCDVAQLVALTRRAAVVVGGDSGPVHLAAALGRPLVAMYGPTDPARNGPWGPGPMRVLRDAGSVTTYKRTSAVEAGLARIGAETVIEAVRAVVR